MKTEMDLKKLWQKQPVDEQPDISVALRKAKNITRGWRIKLILQNLVLFGATAIIFKAGLINHTLITTKIGAVMMILAMLSYLVVYNQIIPVLFKNNVDSSIQEYMDRLLRIKRKEDFVNKVMINVYFTLLTVGLAIFLLQFLQTAKLMFDIIFCTLTFGWMGFAWFYARPHGVKRKQKPLLEMINRLEALNKQLREEEKEI
jgi:hypothetical protein